MNNFISFANDLANISGEIIRKYFRAPMHIDIKPDKSPVTKVDQEVEMAIRDAIARKYPDHGISPLTFKIRPNIV